MPLRQPRGPERPAIGRVTDYGLGWWDLALMAVVLVAVIVLGMAGVR